MAGSGDGKRNILWGWPLIYSVGMQRYFKQGRIWGEGAGGAHPPEMTCGFLINTLQSAPQLYKIFFII